MYKKECIALRGNNCKGGTLDDYTGVTCHETAQIACSMDSQLLLGLFQFCLTRTVKG